MAFEAILQLFSAAAAADLSAKQFYGVQLDSSGNFNLATAAKNIDGVLQNKPVSGQAATVALDGITKVAISGTVTAGQLLEVDTGGTFKAVASGTAVLKAIDGGATGNIITARILRSNAVYS